MDVFIVRFLRFLRGYVGFIATGGFVERFINLIVKNGIPVWGGNPQDYFYTGYTTVKGYKKSRKYARKAGVRLRVSEKRGLPFIVRRYRKRTGLLAGLALFLVFTAVMSAFVWTVKISGNEHVSAAEIEQNLAELGVKPGAFKAALDIREIQREMLLRVGRLSWIAINLRGSTANVEVNERVLPPEPIDEGAPCNIVAAESGQIKYMEVYEGDPMIKVGDTVLKGEVIVSGLTEDKAGNTALKRARAKVIAYVEEITEVSVPLTRGEPEETGEVIKRSYLRILDKRIKLFFGEEVSGLYYKTTQESSPELLFLGSPVGVINETYVMAREKSVTITAEQAKAEALSQLALFERGLKENAEIVQRITVGEIKNGSFVIEARYTCETDIALQSEILTE